MSKKKVVAISGSLRNPSFTEKMLDLCIEGMGEDVDVEKFYPHKMDINPCAGCFACWTKHPGVCVHKDDYSKFFDAFIKADYFLVATPLYIFHLPAPVKKMFDRMFINLKPDQFQLDEGRTMHPKRYEHLPKLVLISSCGFPEIENFDHLRSVFSILSDEMGSPLVGKILISAAGLHQAPRLFNKKYELIKQAGHELRTEDRIKPETIRQISEIVMPSEDYRELVNAAFKGGVRGKMKMVTLAMKAMKNLNN